MSDERPIRRRTLLQGGLLTTLGFGPVVGQATETRAVEDYTNADGVVDATGLGDAARDFRAGRIGADLLNDVAAHWRSGDTINGGGSANPARLIESHVRTLDTTGFELRIDEYEAGRARDSSKRVVFEWDHDEVRSRIVENSREELDVDLAQLFTADRQYVDLGFADGQRNDAVLAIDEGPVYIDGSEILDRLLIGASLSFDMEVRVGGETFPKYDIDSHRNLTDASGYVVGSENAYIAELELRWTTTDDERATVRIETDTESVAVATSYGSLEPAVSIEEMDGSLTTEEHDTFLRIEDPLPTESSALEYGSRETFDCTVEYDIGTEQPGYLSVSVREDEHGPIGTYVDINEQSGSVDVRYTRNVGDDWDQARLIINSYPESDGCPGPGCINTVIASDEVVYEMTDDADAGDRDGPRPDLVVRDLDWSPRDPEPREVVEFSVDVENTGDATAETVETRVFVDGELAHVPPTIDLDPGERRWTVETGNQSFDPGEYTARAIIDPDDKILEQSRSGNELERTLTVGSGEGTVDATIEWMDVDGGTYYTGETVGTTVSVENTGTTTHTFFVGYTVYDPAEDGYDNDGETGRTVTLGPEESTWVDLGWTVEDGAAEGSYDVVVAVWEERDRDSLYTRLDAMEESDQFVVDADEELPDLAVSSVDWTPSGPVESDGVTFSVTVANEGGSRAEDVPVEVTLANEGFDTVVQRLNAGERRTVELGEWRAVAGSTTVRASVDPEDTIEEAGEHDNTAIDTVAVEREESTMEIDVGAITAGSGQYRRGERAEVTTELMNAGDATTVEIEHRLVSPADTTRVETITETIDADSSTFVTTEWELTNRDPTGTHDVTVSVSGETTGKEVATRTERGVFELVTDGRSGDLTVETVDARGERLDGVVVTLNGRDGGTKPLGHRQRRDGRV